MAVRITYFVHGTSTDNEAGLSSGWSNPTLSALGVKQAEELKKTLDSSFRWNDGEGKFDAVFSSDLARAADTAKIVFGDNVILDARLRECNYGLLNGKESSIVELMQEKLERFPEGESYEDVKKRIADFLGFLKQEHNGKRIAVVSHKAPQLSLDVLLRGKTWEQAFVGDWRRTSSWQSGWEYELLG